MPVWFKVCCWCLKLCAGGSTTEIDLTHHILTLQSDEADANHHGLPAHLAAHWETFIKVIKILLLDDPSSISVEFILQMDVLLKILARNAIGELVGMLVTFFLSLGLLISLSLSFSNDF
jgi:hypothetical protein